jgi:hypothetical protein
MKTNVAVAQRHHIRVSVMLARYEKCRIGTVTSAEKSANCTNMKDRNCALNVLSKGLKKWKGAAINEIRNKHRI